MSTTSVPIPDRPAATPAAAPSPATLSRAGMERRRTFAQRRLTLGITGVGLSVVLSVGWIAITTAGLVPLPDGWRPLSRSYGVVGDSVIAALLVFFAHAALLAPVEYRGGAVVVRERPGAAAWARRWLRGIAVQATLFAIATAALATGALMLGSLGVGLAAVASVVLLLALQGRIARLVARLPLAAANDEVRRIAVASGVRPDRIRVADAADEAFVGGWIGLGSPELWIPARWTDSTNARLLAVQFARRHSQWTSGARRRGVLRAALWNVIGVLLLAPLLPWPLADARTFLVLPAAATLWSFLAVLLLPAPSRTAVYNADRAAASRLGTIAVSEAITRLDRWQDDEPERSPGVEWVFHPVPSRGNRLRALTRDGWTSYGGGHQLTRLTLFTALGTLSLLGRVVHCNIGRPALWVVYPGD